MKALRATWARATAWLQADERRLNYIGRILIAIGLAMLASLFFRAAWVYWAASAATDTKWGPVVVAIVVFICVLAWPALSRMSSGAAGLATAITAVIGLFLILLPDLRPPRVEKFEFRNILIERNVSFREYRLRESVMRVLGPEDSDNIPDSDPVFERIGSVVLFDSELTGRPEAAVELRWALFDATLMDRLADSTTIDPLCLHRRFPEFACLYREPARGDSDAAGFEVWVDTGRFPTVDCFFVRLEAMSEGVRLSAADSEPFAADDAAATSCSSLGTD